MIPTVPSQIRSRLLFFLILILILITPSGALAQWELGFGAIGNVPVDRFKDSDYKPGVGMFTNLTTSSILPKVSPWKLQFGMYLDYQWAGNKQFDVILEDPMGADGKTTLRNASTAQHFLVRYGYAFDHRWTCFTDLIVGHRKFFSETQTGLAEHDELYEDQIERVHSFNTYRHGIGFGVRYSVGRSFGIEMRADYTRGGKVTYFDLDKVQDDGTSIVYENQSWAHSDLFVGTISLNWKLFRPEYEPGYLDEVTTTRDDYYDDYGRTSGSSPTYNSNTTRTNRNTTRTRTSSPTVKKKTVSSSKPVEEKKKEEKKIGW